MAHADSLDEFWNTARGSEEVFDPVQVASLPEPARRYVNHAIAPGTLLARAVRLRMHGQIKLKKWASFTAEEVIRWDRGMIGEANVKNGEFFELIPFRSCARSTSLPLTLAPNHNQ